MFRREAVATPAPQPAAPVVRRENRPAAKSRIFTEGRTFAERKASAASERPQRLASMGRTEYTQRDPRTGRPEVVPAELFYDLDHPIKRYVRIDGVPGLHALDAGDQRGDEVTTLPPLPRRTHGPSELTMPSTPEPPPRPI